MAIHKQLGVTGLRHQEPYIYEDFLPQLRWPQAAKVYQEMADNDPIIGAVLYLAEMLIRGTTWTVEAAGDSPVDKEAAEFLESCMHDMESSWADTICEVLSMLTYGFSFHEIVYKVRRGPEETSNKYCSKYSDGRIGWRKMPIRSQASLDGWEFNDEGDASAFIQCAEPDYKRVTIPFDRGMLFRTKLSRGNPEGRSLLRNVYRPWFFKKHFEEIEGIGIERDLAGFPVLVAPEGMDLWNTEDPNMVELRKDAESLVASVRRDSEEGVLLPHGWDLRLLTSGSSRQIDVGETIKRYDNRIATAMLSDIVLLGDKSGSFALADIKQSMLGSALQSQLSNIADTINSKAVVRLFKYNTFPGLVECPRIVPTKIQSPTLSEVALVLRAAGLDISKDMQLQNHLRHILSMPALDKETFDSVYAPQAEIANKPTSNQDDSAEKLFEQNDLNYT